MPHVVHIERSFIRRGEAERYFDTLKSEAWPYVWCIEDVDSGRWLVSALVETSRYNNVA